MPHTVLLCSRRQTNTRTTHDDVHPATLYRHIGHDPVAGGTGCRHRVRPLLAASRLLLLLLLLLSFKATATKTRVPYITETAYRFFWYNVRVVRGVHTRCLLRENESCCEFLHICRIKRRKILNLFIFFRCFESFPVGFDHVEGRGPNATDAILLRRVRRPFRRLAMVRRLSRLGGVRRTVRRLFDVRGHHRRLRDGLLFDEQRQRARTAGGPSGGRGLSQATAVGGERARAAPHEQLERSVRPAPRSGAVRGRRTQTVQIRNAPDGPDVHRRAARPARRAAQGRRVAGQRRRLHDDGQRVFVLHAVLWQAQD